MLTNDITGKEITAKETTAKETTAKETTAKEITAKETTAKEITAKEITAKEITNKEATATVYKLPEKFGKTYSRCLSTGPSRFYIADPAASDSRYGKGSAKKTTRGEKTTLKAREKSEQAQQEKREKAMLKRLNEELLLLYDQLSHAVAGNSFYFDVVDALAAAYKLDIDSHCHLGLTLTSQWLREKDQAVLTQLAELRTWLGDALSEENEL